MDPNEVDPSELFSSPIKPSDLPSRSKTPMTPKTPTPNPASTKQPFDAEEVRAAALARELEGVRNINEVIEGVISTLERAKGNMGSVSQTVTNASTLLNTWTRILSQTEHNQRLLLNKDWAGATRDLEAIEDEKAAEQRRAADADRRREEARREALEREQLRLAAATAGTTATTGRGRGGTARGSARGGTTRGVSRGVGRGGGFLRSGANTSGLGNTSSASVGSSSSSRAGSQIGRGFGSGRTPRGTRGTGAGRGVR